MNAVKLYFEVIGKPVPAGSKRAFPIRRRDGSLGVAVTDQSGLRLKAWMQELKEAAWTSASRVLGKEIKSCLPHAGPVDLCIQFWLRRPKSHFNAAGALRAKAPLYPLTRPDLTKLVRAVEDALTGLLWLDDSQIFTQQVSKSYLDYDRAVDKTLIVVRLYHDKPKQEQRKSSYEEQEHSSG